MTRPVERDCRSRAQARRTWSAPKLTVLQASLTAAGAAVRGVETVSPPFISYKVS